MSRINSNSQVNESSSDWGGKWTETKLDAFAKYVSAYLTIMKKHPYWKTIYFDGFAGSGTRKGNSNVQSELFKLLNIPEIEEMVYKGAAERVLTLQNNLSFDYHYFIDTNENSLNKLKIKLNELQKTKEHPFQYRSGDCNQNLLELSKALKENKNKYAALVLLDPFGMQINWESIESLKNTKTDIWILIPTGVVVNRLLDRSCKLKNAEKLESFFGLSKDEIISFFYEKKKQTTLFGEGVEVIRKICNPIERIARLYSERLKTVWKHVTEEPLPLMNTKGVPIFHFVFASNNENAVKIAKYIIKTV